jgi:TolB-like protein
MRTPVKKLYACISPAEIDNKVREIAKEKGIEVVSFYDFQQTWQDAQHFTVYENFVQCLKTNKKLKVIIRSSYKRSQED